MPRRKASGYESQFAIISKICRHGPLSSKELQRLTHLHKNTIWRNLRILKELKVVEELKHGRHVKYKLACSPFHAIYRIIVFQAFMGNKNFKRIRTRFRKFVRYLDKKTKEVKKETYEFSSNYKEIYENTRKQFPEIEQLDVWDAAFFLQTFKTISPKKNATTVPSTKKLSLNNEHPQVQGSLWLSDADFCPECHSRNLAYREHEGEIVCRNCGLVLQCLLVHYSIPKPGKVRKSQKRSWIKKNELDEMRCCYWTFYSSLERILLDNVGGQFFLLLYLLGLPEFLPEEAIDFANKHPLKNKKLLFKDLIEYEELLSRKKSETEKRTQRFKKELLMDEMLAYSLAQRYMKSNHRRKLSS